jgi:hypothetical protein
VPIGRATSGARVGRFRTGPAFSDWAGGAAPHGLLSFAVPPRLVTAGTVDARCRLVLGWPLASRGDVWWLVPLSRWRRMVAMRAAVGAKASSALGCGVPVFHPSVREWSSRPSCRGADLHKHALSHGCPNYLTSSTLRIRMTFSRSIVPRATGTSRLRRESRSNGRGRALRIVLSGGPPARDKQRPISRGYGRLWN